MSDVVDPMARAAAQAAATGDARAVLNELARDYGRQWELLLDGADTAMRNLWLEVGGASDQAAAAWAREAGPLISGIQSAAAEGAVAWMDTQVAAMGAASLPAAEAVALEPATALLESPPLKLRGLLAQGMDYAEAVQNVAGYVSRLTTTTTRAAEHAGRMSRATAVKGYIPPGRRRTTGGRLVRDERAGPLVYARVPDAKACKWCLVVADRLYSEQGMTSNWHAYCRCTWRLATPEDTARIGTYANGKWRDMVDPNAEFQADTDRVVAGYREKADYWQKQARDADNQADATRYEKRADQWRQRADQREAAAAARPRSPRPVEVPEPPPVLDPKVAKAQARAEAIADAASRYGVSPEAVEAHMPQVRAMRKRVAADAAATQYDSMGVLERAEAVRIKRPARRVADRSGEADWVAGLSQTERDRLARRWWTDSDAAGYDLVADTFREQIPGIADWTDDQILAEIWLPHTRRIEAAGALRRGKIPSDRTYAGLDPNELVPNVHADGFDVAHLLADDYSAAAHIAAVETARHADGAYRMLGAATRSDQPPWSMSFGTWEAEVRDLEYERTLVAGWSPAQRARYDELVPYDLDAGDASYEELYARIIETARLADLKVAPHAVIPWA